MQMDGENAISGLCENIDCNMIRIKSGTNLAFLKYLATLSYIFLPPSLSKIIAYINL